MAAKRKKVDFKLLQMLSEAFGVSGAEEDVRKILEKELKPYVDELFVDKMGNLIAHQFGEAPKVMLAAHMDEVGLMVKNINEDGRVRFSTVGYLEPITLISQRVAIITNKRKIDGMITTDNICYMQPVKKVPTINELYVDTGMKKSELKKAGVITGTYISLQHEFLWLGKNRATGKALDDRIGCLALVELAKRLKNIKNDTYFVFTVQEEMGLYGAKTSAYEIKPEWALVVDVANADDGKSGSKKDIEQGPTLTVKDSELIANVEINKWIMKIAQKLKIPIQLDLCEEGTSDAVNILLSRSGVPSTVIGVAVRNLHSNISMAHKRDITQLIKLLEELFKKAPSYGARKKRRR